MQIRKNYTSQADYKKGTCPKSLRYNLGANILINEDFQSDIQPQLEKKQSWPYESGSEISPQTCWETYNNAKKMS